MRQKSKIRLIMIVILSSLFCGFPVKAEETLPPGMVVGDTDGIHVDSTGAYYVHEEDVKPGDVFIKTIQIMNTEKGDRPYLLEMDIAPKEKQGAIDFYEAIHVKMQLGDQTVYDGNLIGLGTPDIQNQRLALGTYAYGEKNDLIITFTVSDSLPDDVWKTKSYAVIKWNFYAEKVKKINPPAKKPPILPFLPQTGEEWRRLIYKIIVGIFIISVVLLINGKRKQRNLQ